MVPKWTCAIIGGLLLLCSLNRSILLVAAEDENEDRKLAAGIELSELDYEDKCVPVSKAHWKFLHQPNDPYLLEQWKSAAIEFANFKKEESQMMKSDFNETYEESSLSYKLGVIEYPGDASMSDEDYSKLVSFIAENQALKASTRYLDDTKNLTREEVDFLLSHNGKEEEKLKVWATWHQHFTSQVDNFTSVLHLAQKAASANGKSDVKSYWEMLVGEPNSYDTFKYQLETLTELQMKLVNFARKRLSKKYDLEIRNDSIPAHLLGSLSGYDWTHLALDVVPYPDVIIQMRKSFWEKKLMGKFLYKSASGLGRRFLGKNPEAEFWSESDFRAECPSNLVNLCKLGKVRVSTCNEPSLSNYLTAHKDVAKILMHQMSNKNPILNDFNRQSVLEEAVAELFSILAASPAWLKHEGLLEKSVGSEEAKMTSLAITALDVLPRLAYYVAADKWRLEAIDKNETDTNQLVSDWWENRLNNEFTYSSDGEPPTFLSDDQIVNNKPYLSKVLGIVLAFQMYNYVMKSTEIRHEPFDKSSFNRELILMVQNNSDNWKSLIDKYMSIDTISLDSMNDYFSELGYYFDSYEEPDETYDFNAKEIELEQLEKRYRKIANTPTTTTSTTTTTTARPLSKTKPAKDVPKDSLTRSNSDTGPASTQQSSDSRDTNLQEKGMMPDEESDSMPKMNTSKAVWAVAAVLVATLTICIVAIFSRRRCSRTPKNRRYV